VRTGVAEHATCYRADDETETRATEETP